MALMCLLGAAFAQDAPIDYFQVNARFAQALAALPQQPHPDLAAFVKLGRAAAEVDPEAVLTTLKRIPAAADSSAEIRLAREIVAASATLRARRLLEARTLIDALPAWDSTPERTLSADVLLLRVTLAQFTGQFGEAQRLVVALFDQLDRQRPASMELKFRALTNLSTIQGRMRDGNGALETNQKALALAREINDPMLIARALINRGQIYTVLSQHEQCRALLAQVSQIAAKLPPGDLSINLDLALSVNAANLGRPADGAAALTRALASARALGNTYYEAFALSAVAQGEELAGKPLAAAATYALSEQAFERLKSPEDAARMATLASDAFSAGGDLKRALEALRRTRAHYLQMIAAQRDASADALQRSLLVQRKDAEVAAVRLTAERDGAKAAAASLQAQLALTAALLTAAVALALGLWVMGLRRRNAALAQIDHARAQTLAQAAHEIRNPLAAIQGLIDLGLHRPPGASLVDLLQPASAAASALIDTTHDYLDHAQLSLGAMGTRMLPFDLIALMDSLLALYRAQATQKGLALKLDTALSAPLWVRGDAQKLRQILNNLLGNAVKFSDRGEITLALERIAANYYRFSVSDQGPGIAAEHQDRVFKPFTRAHANAAIPGAGLGLCIAAQLTELLGGALTLTPKAGVGTRLSFALDLPAALAAASLPTSPNATAMGASKQVLVVDDDPHVRALLRLQLESFGVSVVEASTVEDGLQCWRQFRPGLVLVDYHLKGAIGTNLTAAIRAEDSAATRMVIISASLARSQSVGTDAIWIAKPLSLKTLGELLGIDAPAAPDALGAQ